MQPCLRLLLINSVIFLIFCCFVNFVFINTSSVDFFRKEQLCFIDEISTSSSSLVDSPLILNYTIGVYYSIYSVYSSRSLSSHSTNTCQIVSPIAYIDSSFIIPSYMFSFINLVGGAPLSYAARRKLAISSYNLVAKSLHTCYVDAYYLNASTHIDISNNNVSDSLTNNDYVLKSAQLTSLTYVSRVYYQIVFFCIIFSLSSILFMYHLTVIITTAHQAYYLSYCIGKDTSDNSVLTQRENQGNNAKLVLLDDDNDYNNAHSSSISNHINDETSIDTDYVKSYLHKNAHVYSDDP